MVKFHMSLIAKRAIPFGFIVAVVAAFYLVGYQFFTGACPEINTIYFYWYPGIKEYDIVSYTIPVAVSPWWEIPAAFVFGFLFRMARDACRMKWEWDDAFNIAVLTVVCILPVAVGFAAGVGEGSSHGIISGLSAGLVVTLSLGAILGFLVGIVMLFAYELSTAYIFGLAAGFVFGLAHGLSLGITLTFVYGLIAAVIWYVWRYINSLRGVMVF